MQDDLHGEAAVQEVCRGGRRVAAHAGGAVPARARLRLLRRVAEQHELRAPPLAQLGLRGRVLGYALRRDTQENSVPSHLYSERRLSRL